MMKQRASSKQPEQSPERESALWYGVWLSEPTEAENLTEVGLEESDLAQGTWLRDSQGWVIHYPAEAIAAAHANEYNAHDAPHMAGKLQASAKPFLAIR